MHEANNGLNVDLLWTGQRSREMKVLQKACEEEEDLVLSQLLTQAISLANQEWDEAIIFGKLASLSIDESHRIECLRSLPVLRVVHDP